MSKQYIKNLPDINIPATNCLKVFLPGLTLFYSYETCVGFNAKGIVMFTNQSYSQTTARHMSGVFGASKEDKVSPEKFKYELERALAGIFQESA
jgi:hypothetical protein